MPLKKNFKRGARFIGRGLKRGAKSVGKGLKKRYIHSGGGLNVGQIAKDVWTLKKVINAEKKYVEITPFGQVSQFTCNVAGTNLDTGWYATDITPTPAEGVTFQTRTGMSIKLCSMVGRIQLSGMANCASAVKLDFMIFKNMGETQTINSTLIAKLFNQDALSGFTDLHSLRNPAYFKNFRVVCHKRLKVPMDSLSGQVQIKDYAINLRLNHHVKFNYDTTTVSSGQLFLVIRADNGNNGSANAAGGFLTTTPPMLTAQSGVNVYQNYRFYYYDN